MDPKVTNSTNGPNNTKAGDHTETSDNVMPPPGTKSTTPASTPSRASTAPIIDSIERATSMDISSMDTTSMDTSAEPNPVEFKPLQMLMKTPIQIECGPDLATKLTVHEEILRCHSKLLNQRYTDAKFERDKFIKRNAFHDEVATYVCPKTTPKQFVESKHEAKVIPIIVRAYDRHSWGYSVTIKETIDSAVEYELAEKNTKSPIPTTGPKRKTPKEMTIDMSLGARLELLKPRGVQNVATELFSILFRIQNTEANKAKVDPIKAATQGRLLLPNFEENTVRALVQWIYGGGVLEDHGAEELYALLMLATELQVVALTEACLSMLCNAVSDSVQQAQTRGIPLRGLLGYESVPWSATATDSVVSVIFGHAFKDKNMPGRLFKLVIDILAEGMDTELFAGIKDLVNHGMAIQLLEAVLARQQIIKTELYDQSSIKSESEEALAGQPSQAG